MKSESKHIPSILNDVLGPVMRGPSSSHSVAALRIGRICRDLMLETPEKVRVSYDAGDALATTHESQGSVLIGRLETIFQVMAYYPSNTFELKGVHDEI